MKLRMSYLLVVCSIGISETWSNVLHVPAHYSTIQAAIDASVHGDTVLVAPGTYAENIRFKGKKILVTSHFALNSDRSFILSTIINGSTPAHPDTASCVLIISGEDSTAVLQGFTLRGGRGTKWIDEPGAGTYWEGGGVLTALSSPTIRYNLIMDNEAISVSGGAVSAGGGGIRSGDGAPRIMNNVVVGNRSMYGGGIVLNYCAGAIVRNNIFSQNIVFQAVNGAFTFGGGGVWINNQLPGNASLNRVENNTIVGNASFSNVQQGDQGRAGGIIVRENSIVHARNNIVWGNLQSFGGQVVGGTNFSASYNLIEGGFAGTGNINANPSFAESAFHLAAGSPCIDAGDPAVTYNDPEDPLQPGMAEWPSMGNLRNDIGAYGGPWRALLAGFSRPALYLVSRSYDFGNILPGGTGRLSIPIKNNGAARLTIDSVRILFNVENVITVTGQFPFHIGPGGTDSLHLQWTPLQNGILSDSARIYHNDSLQQNPQNIHLSGNANPTPRLFLNTAEHNFGLIDVNIPSRDTTFLVYNIGTGTDSVYVAINYGTLTPPEALSVFPASFQIAPGDSQGVTFTVYPPRINRSGLDIYSPRALIRSRFGLGSPVFEKPFRFRIVGTLPVSEPPARIPAQFALDQNYPNPFNPSTTIRYSLAHEAFVTLKVFDILGSEVLTLVHMSQPAGEYSVGLDASSLPGSGMYFLRLKSGHVSETKKLVLLK